MYKIVSIWGRAFSKLYFTHTQCFSETLVKRVFKVGLKPHFEEREKYRLIGKMRKTLSPYYAWYYPRSWRYNVTQFLSVRNFHSFFFFAITLLLFQARSSMNAKIRRWKFDEKHDIYVVTKHLPHILFFFGRILWHARSQFPGLSSWTRVRNCAPCNGSMES